MAGAALGTSLLMVSAGVLAPQALAAAPVDTPVAVQPPSPPVPVGEREVFVGDYETGDFTQWGQCQSKLHNTRCRNIDSGNRTMQIVSEPENVRQGRFAARFNVRSGDVPEFGGGERSEVQSNAPGAVVEEGDERWYQWSTKFPEDFENPTADYFIILQWHSSSGPPPLAINVSRQGTVDIGGDGIRNHPKRTIGPVRPGEWIDYVMHVKFSQDSEEGFVQAWENGVQTVPMTKRATMNDESNYLKQGIYRRGGDEVTLYQDALRITAPAEEPTVGLDVPGLPGISVHAPSTG